MLTELHIEDLGVIERAELVLGPGLTAVTGETGAGKTMLVEAIGLLVGERADPAMVRSGASEARVEGRFVVGDDEVVLARVVPVEGRSRAYVNGRLATVATLAEHGARLVDLHGQHAHQSLLTTAAQRDALDRFAGVDLSPLRAARAQLTEIDAALAALGGDARARAREIDLLRFQVDELAVAAIEGPDEDVALEALEDVLADAAAHREAATRALAALVGDERADDAGAALDALAAALRALDGRSPFTDVSARLHGLAAELADAAAELRAAAEAIDEDPQRLADVRARRQLLHELRRKYGDTLAEVVAYQAEAAERLADLESFEERAGRLDAERAAAVDDERAAARAVGRARRRGAPELAAAVQAHLAELAMPQALVEVEVGAGPDDPGPCDDVRFLLAANPGTAPLALAKVASGGELARTMLALRLVLTEAPDTLLFDEVDAGIGGTAAVAVAAALARVAQRHQVLVVTHLPQVAAAAGTQITVSKTVEGESTRARAHRVDGAERVDELARMLSGRPDSASARRHAAELLAGRS
jgi:DNA repair protein RecN (Recombination protein N)